MKERPILFGGSMVCAILGGSKTQTRRVVKPQPIGFFGGTRLDSHTFKAIINGPKGIREHPVDHYWNCPYGQPGDRLWVRETFCQIDGGGYAYKSTDAQDADAERCRLEYGYKWTPSIYMPRVASRITLEVVNVRVERGQEINECDVIAEGISLHDCLVNGEEILASFAYAQLWDSLNAKRGYGWDVNPWVWVIEFKQVTT